MVHINSNETVNVVINQVKIIIITAAKHILADLLCDLRVLEG